MNQGKKYIEKYTVQAVQVLQVALAPQVLQAARIANLARAGVKVSSVSSPCAGGAGAVGMCVIYHVHVIGQPDSVTKKYIEQYPHESENKYNNVYIDCESGGLQFK